jgi:hypothetical protein
MAGAAGDRAPYGLSAAVGCGISVSSVARTGDTRFFRRLEPSAFSLDPCPVLAARGVDFFDRVPRGNVEADGASA